MAFVAELAPAGRSVPEMLGRLERGEALGYVVRLSREAAATLLVLDGEERVVLEYVPEVEATIMYRGGRYVVRLCLEYADGAGCAYYAADRGEVEAMLARWLETVGMVRSLERSGV